MYPSGVYYFWDLDYLWEKFGSYLWTNHKNTFNLFFWDLSAIYHKRMFATLIYWIRSKRKSRSIYLLQYLVSIWNINIILSLRCTCCNYFILILWTHIFIFWCFIIKSSGTSFMIYFFFRLIFEQIVLIIVRKIRMRPSYCFKATFILLVY